MIKMLTLYEQEKIGFTYLFHQLHCVTPYGLAEKRKIGYFPKASHTALLTELDHVDEQVQNLRETPAICQKIVSGLSRIKDLTPILQKLSQATRLDDIELFEIKHFALLFTQFAELYPTLTHPLPELCIPSLEPVIKVLDPQGYRLATFQVYDEYSEKLAQIRADKKSLEEKIYQSPANDHPALFEQRNDLVLAEKSEIHRICKYLTNVLQPMQDLLRSATETLAYYDLLQAKATLAVQFQMVKPVFHPSNLTMSEMHNPQVKQILADKDQSYTPISVDFPGGMNVITGANMGGKSITLQTILLNVLLAHSGFFVCAKSAIMPHFDFIGALLEDKQDLSQGLSSFGADIIELQKFLNQYHNSHGLFIMDEFARGTNPTEGQIILKAVCTYLQKLSWITLISTHYNGITDASMHHFQVIGLRNLPFTTFPLSQDGSHLVSSDAIRLLQTHMDYRIEKVSSEDSIPHDALKIAEMLGLDSSIITTAQQLKKERENYDSSE